MAVPLETGLTVADLDRYADDDRHKYELVDGELFVSPRGVLRHQWVQSRIVRRLLEWADEHGAVALVEQDLHRDERNYVIPDVMLLTGATLAEMAPDRLAIGPDLLVEVSSPSTRRLDVVIKRALYERLGVPEYWFVDLDADRVEVYRLADGADGDPQLVGIDGRLMPPHLPGLVVEVADILRPLPGR